MSNLDKTIRPLYRSDPNTQTMKKIILYSAQSLNGKIARNDGSVDWLESIPHVDGEDYGYASFYASIDITIQGYSTYKQVLDWGIDFPYKEKKNYVLTRKKELAKNEDVSFIMKNHIDAIRNLKNQNGKNIWLIGGGQINTLLLNAHLIDEIILHTMPIVIPDGIAIFENTPAESRFELLSSKSYSSGVLESHYKIHTSTDN